MDSSEIKRGVRPNGHDSDEILSDIRFTRNRMDNTLNELGDKLQPRHLMEDAVDYFWTREHQTADKAKQSVSKMGRKVVDEVREHPLPSLLIGAGIVWLLSQQHRKAQSMESDEQGPGLKEKAREVLGSAKERLQGMKESARSGAGTLKDKASELKEKASDATGTARDKISSALGTAGEKSSEMKEKAKGYYQHTSQRIQETAEMHPLVVGLGCVAAGIFAGVMAPRTRAEDETFGKAADNMKGEVKQQAEVLAQKGSAVAERAVQAGKEEARQQDLTPEGITGHPGEIERAGEPKAGPEL